MTFTNPHPPRPHAPHSHIHTTVSVHSTKPVQNNEIDGLSVALMVISQKYTRKFLFFGRVVAWDTEVSSRNCTWNYLCFANPWGSGQRSLYMSRIHWVARGNGTPKDRDEVNRREVCHCDGWVCDLDVMGVPSKLSVIRKDTVLARARSTLLLNCWAKASWWKWNWPQSVYGIWTPEVAKKRWVSRWVWKNKRLTNSLCNLPDVV